MLISTSIIDLLLPPANISFNTYRMLIVSHSKAQFLLNAKCAKRDSVFYRTVLNIKGFDITVKHFHFKIQKKDDSINLIVVIALSL